jgi:uncharacterized OB-fold protein
VSDTKPLRGSRCAACQTVYFPPRVHCVTCKANPLTEEIGLRGSGTLYSITNVHFGATAPCSVGYVDLDEGVRALARFEVLDDPSELIGADRRVHIGYGPIGSDTENVVVGSFDPA